MKKEVYKILERASLAIIEWLAHCLIVAFVIVGIKALHLLLESLWETELVFFGKIPASDLVAAADFSVLVGVLVLGVACVVKAYQGEPRD